MYYEPKVLYQAHADIAQLNLNHKFVFQHKESIKVEVLVGHHTAVDYCEKCTFVYIKFRTLHYGDHLILKSYSGISHAIMYCKERNFTCHLPWRHLYLNLDNPKEPNECYFGYVGGPDNYNTIWNVLNEI